MWLVLCAANDLAGLWAARGLANFGLAPLEIVTPEALVYNRSFEHRLTAGQPSVHITLADGRVIDGATVRGTLNRLQVVPYAHLRAASAKDRAYAEQELFALYLSVLQGLSGVMLNRPSPQSLGGDWRHPAEWASLAARAGLITETYEQSDSGATRQAVPTVSVRTVVAVNGECCGARAPQAILAGCSRLAELAATGILGMDFRTTLESEWVFQNATPLPDLRVGGHAVLATIAQALKQ
jgi:hypothetical protein